MGEFLGERFPWEGPLRVSVVGGSILVMGMRCPCKHLFLGLNVMGESTVKRDCLEGVLSAKLRRWEKPLEKDLLGSIHSLRREMVESLSRKVFPPIQSSGWTYGTVHHRKCL